MGPAIKGVIDERGFGDAMKHLKEAGKGGESQ